LHIKQLQPSPAHVNLSCDLNFARELEVFKDKGKLYHRRLPLKTSEFKPYLTVFANGRVKVRLY